ncbi:hypothetical protein BML2496_12060 [Providencia rettgeri]|nr:GAD-like domain-containing protein [Providencia sp. PROV156]BBU95323.1 hypothetical protein BML2496_12060 [Providencia rettgeri]
MRDEAFELFVEKFGEASTSRYVSEEKIEKWRGKLPELLLTIGTMKDGVVIIMDYLQL